nr:methylamine utilization protein [Lelliottia steviae]
MIRIILLLLTFSPTLMAQKIQVVDQNSQPVANAAVWLKGHSQSPSTEASYTMSQENRAFSPHVLVVPKGANVEFPNLDSIMHHVYSFSKAKHFELKLYRDKPEKPVRFEQTGVVELGCNIHDWMLGYIVVVDSPSFAQTDEQGFVDLDLPEGTFELAIWHDRLSDISEPEITSFNSKNSVLRYQLKQALLPALELSSDEFDDYE